MQDQTYALNPSLPSAHEIKQSIKTKQRFRQHTLNIARAKKNLQKADAPHQYNLNCAKKITTTHSHSEHYARKIIDSFMKTSAVHACCALAMVRTATTT